MSEKMNHKRKPTSYYRGHSIYYDYETEKWCYEDNDKYIKSENRPCTRCGKTPTLSGADYCLKDLEVCDFINAACCGHGERIGYISLQDGRIFREIDSDDILFKMFRLENENKNLKKENDKLKDKLDSIRREVINIDMFSDEALNHDIIAYREMHEFDNKDCYDIAWAIEKIKNECFR